MHLGAPPGGRVSAWIQSAQATSRRGGGQNSSRRFAALGAIPPRGGRAPRARRFQLEGLYQDEFDAGSRQDLKDRMAALDRAEARLADGTYGLSVKSGEPIPDGRLEVNPIAELTVEEQDPSSRAS